MLNDSGIRICTVGAGKQIYCKIKVNKQDKWVLVDPGAGISIIEQSLVNSVRVVPLKFRVVTAKGDPIGLVGRSELRIEIGTLKVTVDVIVSNELPHGLFILGNDILDKYDFSIEYRAKKFTLRGSGQIEFEFANRNSFGCSMVSVEEHGVSPGVLTQSSQGKSTPSSTLVSDGPILETSGIEVTLARHLCLDDDTRTTGRRVADRQLSDCRVPDIAAQEMHGHCKGMSEEKDSTYGVTGEIPTQIPGGEVMTEERGSQVSDVSLKPSESTDVADTLLELGQTTSLDGSLCEPKQIYVGGERPPELHSTMHEKVQKNGSLCEPKQIYVGGERPPELRSTMHEKVQKEVIVTDPMLLELTRYDEGISVWKREARVRETVCLEPNTITDVSVVLSLSRLNREVDNSELSFQLYSWMVSPKLSVELKYGISIFPSIVMGGQGRLSVSNLSDDMVTLSKGLRLGSVVEAEEIENDICVNSLSMDQRVREFDPKYFNINPDADLKDRISLLKILKDNWDIFAFSNEELGCTGVVEHSIDTGNAKPIRQRLWTRYSAAENEFISQQVKEMLDCGVIVRSYTPWVCNVVLAPKQGGQLRFACDYRAVNAVTQFSNYPLPRISDILDSLSGSAVFSKLDLISGYWQVKMCESDGSDLKTGFVTRDGCFIFKRMPFGVKNGPQEFQALMDKLFCDMRGKIANYMDDLTPHAPTAAEHNQILVEVFSRLRKAGLKVKISKCSFLYTKIKYLGFVVDGEGIRPDPAKIKVISDMPVPRTLKDLRSFLGMVTFYKKFIPRLAFIAQPLFKLLATSKLTAPWDREQTRAFEDIKTALVSSELLVHRNESLPIELMTDACDYAVGGVLVQVHTKRTLSGRTKREERPLQYASRTLTGPERKWSIPEKEALALIFCLSLFRPYLAMRKFIIRTDHLALIYLNNLKDPIKTRIGRWALKLQEFDCQIVYQPGPKNVVADALSRNPWEKPLDTQEVLEIPTFSLASIRENFCIENSLKVGKEEEKLNLEISQLGIDIAQYQLLDEFCKEVLVHMEGLKGFEVKEGVLYKVREGHITPRVVVPLVLRAILIDLYHSNRFSAHLGRNKTTAKMMERFYWKGMHKDIENYIQKCLKCKFHKLPLHKRPGLLNPINPFEQGRKLTPGMFLSADLLGPFPISAKGNRMILVISDILTRYVIVGAIPSGTAEEVAEFLVNNVICVYGAFRILLTDNGTCFRSKLMQELARLLDFQGRFTTPYSPEINGLTERFNKTLAAMLSPFMEKGKYTEWDKNLAAVVFAYNTSVQASTQEIPFFLTFGRHAILPMDVALKLPSSSLSAETIANRLAKAFSKSNERLVIAQQRQKKNFDLGRRKCEYQIGDLVLYEIPTRRKGEPDKFQPKCKGPYKIVNCVGKNTYVIEDTSDKPKREIVGGRRLIKFVQDIESEEESSQSDSGQLHTPSIVNPTEPERENSEVQTADNDLEKVNEEAGPSERSNTEIENSNDKIQPRRSRRQAQLGRKNYVCSINTKETDNSGKSCESSSDNE